VATEKSDFATRVVRWQAQHGRNNLPWQNTRDPYRVWLSEIMLQQTQVVTVKSYFKRFLERCPDVASLAAASQDEVLGLWSGLGYYSRARNLHRCAQQVMECHGGVFPRDAATLATLPGIGPSTAAAIASLCFSERVAILDANVKRVVARVCGFDGDVSVAANTRVLWELATALLPARDRALKEMARYTQGMMDLGAMVCTPKDPKCSQCPVQQDCVACKSADPQRFPVRSRRVKRSSASVWLLWAKSPCGAVWLTKRPASGIWAGLHCLPVFDSEADLRQSLPPDLVDRVQCEAAFVHVLTHKDLHLHPCRIEASSELQFGLGRWVAAEDWIGLGLPAPVRKLLER